MDVITHQRALDFTPGTEYSYSNSGYQLLATIVERVSKQSLPPSPQSDSLSRSGCRIARGATTISDSYPVGAGV